MGILDDAIKEHLDLKRRHGARESELREIEEDAFGSGEGPDPFAAGELFQGTAPPGESEPGAGPATPPGDAGGDEPTRLIQPRASAEAPPAEPPPVEAPPAEPPPPGLEPPTPEPPGAGPPTPAPPPSREPSPFDSEPPAAREPEAPELPGSEPPLESHSLADLMAEEDVEPDHGAPGTPPPPAAASEAPPAPAPSDQGLAPTETPREPQPPAAPEPSAEPEIQPAPAEPEAPSDSGLDVEPEIPLDASQVPDPPPPPPPGSEPPGRARGRVHHPTEEFMAEGEAEAGEAESEEIAPPSSGPLEPEGARPGADEAEPAAPAAGDGPELFDFESDVAPVEPAPADDFEDLGPLSDEAYPEDEAYVEEPGTEAQPAAPDSDEGFAEPGADEGYADPGTEEPPPPPAPPAPDAPASDEEGEDLLADSPEFVDEGGDEDEQDLWFEKGPPQDFDFEDEDR